MFYYWIIVRSIPFLHSCYPCSCSGSSVLQRFCTSSLTWPPGLLSDSIQIYSSCRDFYKLYIQLCQSSAKALQIYIYNCQDEAQACQHSLLTTWAAFFAHFSTQFPFCFIFQQHWTAQSFLHTHFDCCLHLAINTIHSPWNDPLIKLSATCPLTHIAYIALLIMLWLSAFLCIILRLYQPCFFISITLCIVDLFKVQTVSHLLLYSTLPVA